MIRSVVMALVVLWGVVSWGQQFTLNMQDAIEFDYGGFVNIGIDIDYDGQSFAGGVVCVQVPEDELSVIGWSLVGSTLLNLNGDTGPDFFAAQIPAVCSGTGNEYASIVVVADFAGVDFLSEDGLFVKVAVVADSSTQGSLPVSTGVTIYDNHTTNPCTGMPSVGGAQSYITVMIGTSQQDVNSSGSDLFSDVEIRVPGALNFTRGDVNDDDTRNIADPVALLLGLFAGGPLTCHDAGDVNDNGVLDLSDPIYLLTYLFNGGRAPPAPFGASACASDPTSDPLQCATFNSC